MAACMPVLITRQVPYPRQSPLDRGQVNCLLMNVSGSRLAQKTLLYFDLSSLVKARSIILVAKRCAVDF